MVDGKVAGILDSIHSTFLTGSLPYFVQGRRLAQVSVLQRKIPEKKI